MVLGPKVHWALEEFVRQQVVLHDLITRDTQSEENERGSNPGSILAGGAMEDQRTFGSKQVLEELGETAGLVVDERAVEIIHQLDDDCLGELAPGRFHRLHPLNDGRLDCQRMLDDTRQLVGGSRALGIAPKIKGPVESKLRERRMIVRGQAAKVIRPEEPAPADRTPFKPGITPKVSEVRRALQAIDPIGVPQHVQLSCLQVAAKCRVEATGEQPFES